MKRITLRIIFLLALVHTQSLLALKIGPELSSELFSLTNSTGNTIGWRIGALVEGLSNDVFSIQTGLRLRDRKVNGESENYLLIPVRGKLNFSLSESAKLFVRLGADLGLRLSGTFIGQKNQVVWGEGDVGLEIETGSDFSLYVAVGYGLDILTSAESVTFGKLTSSALVFTLGALF